VSIDSQPPEEEAPDAATPADRGEREARTGGGARRSRHKKADGAIGADSASITDSGVDERTAGEEPINVQEAALAEIGGMKFYQRGDLTEGTIVQIKDDSLVVDIGTKTEGIIARAEVSVDASPDLSEFSVGDKVSAVVLSEDEDGTYHLSKRRADQKLVWEKVDESFKEGTRIRATGFRAVKGGLLVNIGTIAFLPQSLVDIRRVDDLEPLVGEKFEVKVVEYDREAQPHPKIVVSRRAVLEEDLTKERDRLYDSLDVGSVVDGKVVKVTNYGAFIDVGGLQGLLHISEMSLGRIRHPIDVMKEGDTIKVKVLKIDKKRKRISLGRRDLLPNPWETIRERYRSGMVVEGTVVRTTEFGAFVRLDDYFEGLAHISELVDNKISHAKEVFDVGDKVNVFIMNVDKKNKRIKLSVRRAAEAQRKAEVAEFMRSQGDLENVFAAQLQEALRDSEIDLPSLSEAAEEVKAAEEPEPVEAEPEEPVAASTALAEAAEEPDMAEAETSSESSEAEAEGPADEPAASEEEPSAEAEAVAEPESPEEKEESPSGEAEQSEEKLESEMNGTPLE